MQLITSCSSRVDSEVEKHCCIVKKVFESEDFPRETFADQGDATVQCQRGVCLQNGEVCRFTCEVLHILADFQPINAMQTLAITTI
jgi:hypothetical protein